MAAMSGIDCIRTNEPLAERTWFKLGGQAQFFAEPRSPEELQSVVTRCRDEGMQARLLGGGSKLLVRDEGVSGMVIRLASPAFTKIQIDGRRATLSGGATLANAITVTVGSGLAGLEPLVGIPGTVGGALHGNAGSHGGDIGQWACAATVMTRGGEIVLPAVLGLQNEPATLAVTHLIALALWG